MCVYECAWSGGVGRYVLCKSGIITIPHLNISIPFAMFNHNDYGLIFSWAQSSRAKFSGGGGGGFSGGNSRSTDTSYVKWFVLFNFSRLAGGRNEKIYYAIMYCIKQEIPMKHQVHYV